MGRGSYQAVFRKSLVGLEHGKSHGHDRTGCLRRSFSVSEVHTFACTCISELLRLKKVCVRHTAVCSGLELAA